MEVCVCAAFASEVNWRTSAASSEAVGGYGCCRVRVRARASAPWASASDGTPAAVLSGTSRRQAEGHRARRL